MNVQKNIYETVFILHPEMTEEEVEAGTQNIVEILESKGSEIIRTERGGKRRLAYQVRKQRYGYYNLIHFRAVPDALTELERTYRLSERILRYLTLRFDKEEQLTGFMRMADDDMRDDEREDRRRGGRRSESFRSRAASEGPRTMSAPDEADAPETGVEPSTAGDATGSAATHEDLEEVTEQVSEETG